MCDIFTFKKYVCILLDVEEEQCSDGHYFKLERDDSSTTSDHDDLDWAEETVVKIEQQEQVTE